MVDESIMLDPHLWAIVAVSVTLLYLLDRTCRWLIDRHSRWSRAFKRVARALMFLLFFALICTVTFYYAASVVF